MSAGIERYLERIRRAEQAYCAALQRVRSDDLLALLAHAGHVVVKPKFNWWEPEYEIPSGMCEEKPTGDFVLIVYLPMHMKGAFRQEIFDAGYVQKDINITSSGVYTETFTQEDSPDPHACFGHYPGNMVAIRFWEKKKAGDRIGSGCQVIADKWEMRTLTLACDKEAEG
jgi:hypothetical protein